MMKDRHDTQNVYPTYALQHLALDEESAPDKLIFVEDVSAKLRRSAVV